MNLQRQFTTKSDAKTFIEANKASIKKLYKKLTARQIAESQNVVYNNIWQKALLETFGSKGLGLGGSRAGSGNKKGIKFCGVCRKRKEKCICKI